RSRRRPSAWRPCRSPRIARGSRRCRTCSRRSATRATCWPRTWMTSRARGSRARNSASSSSRRPLHPTHEDAMMSVRMMSRRLAAMSAALVVAAACGKSDDTSDDTAPAVVQVKTAVAVAQGFTETVSAIGTVSARAGHSASLSAPSAGRVARVLATSGQYVAAGQPLIELDAAPFQANQNSADAALQAAQQAYDREQRLAAEGIVPRKDVEAAAADLARARADRENSAREAQLSVLRSPIAGVVTRMSATLGASVDPSEPLVDIADPNA